MKNMFRIIEKDYLNQYFVTSSNWENTILASSSSEAVSRSLEIAFDQQGDRLLLSPAIIVVDMTNFCLNFSEDHTKVYSTELILHDIGRHDLAKKFKKIIK